MSTIDSENISKPETQPKVRRKARNKKANAAKQCQDSHHQRPLGPYQHGRIRAYDKRGKQATAQPPYRGWTRLDHQRVRRIDGSCAGIELRCLVAERRPSVALPPGE
jgi:hypothetical protein